MISIMQPYFFPYIGYIQMVCQSNIFVHYDDVPYIKQGWINRNRILINDNPSYFTLPLTKASSNKNINEIYLDEEKFNRWKVKFIKTIEQNYSQSPYLKETKQMIYDVINTSSLKLSDISEDSIETCTRALDCETQFIKSSQSFSNIKTNSKQRIYDICHSMKRYQYVNATGGSILYTKEEFQENGIHLFFIESNLQSVLKNHFYMSILDVLLTYGLERTRSLIKEYRLI